ncbi:MAG: hypothetical protein HXX10_07660 [Rhodoplanes sp.]|uniref:hypothetical protein n=1 Tax=Rhodoplanes sp. TaxID=1968906 RepID=UPI00179D0457|nr:hypothetical protein [Rhodoplanes sp.]NVO13897.1 hypothetical protein [Rhodoplanes sp.]
MIDARQYARMLAGLVAVAEIHASTKRNEQMSANVRGLARLVNTMKSVNDQADAIADQLEAHQTRLASGLAAASQMVSDIGAAADDLTSSLSVFTNGGPPLEDASVSATATVTAAEAAAVAAPTSQPSASWAGGQA